MSNNIASILARREAEDPTAPALCAGTETFSYLDLASQARRLAAWLDQEWGAAGRPVAIALPNSPESLHLLHAAWWIGSNAVLVNHTLAPREMSNALADSEPAVFVVRDDLAPGLRDLTSVPVVGVSDALKALPDSGVGVGPVELDADAAGVVIFTSGTSGRPKGAVLSHGALIDATETLARALRGRPGPFPVTASPPTLIALPLAHTGGLCSWIFALYSGRNVVLLERFRLAEFQRVVNDYAVDAVVATPTMLQMMTTAEDLDLSTVRSVQSTGAPLPPAVKERFEARYGLPIIENYGQTEALHVAGWTREDLKKRSWRAGSVGRPYAGVEVAIVQDDGGRCDPGDVGEIVVRSQHLMSNYIEAASGDGTRGEIDVNGYLHTGDLGYLDADGYLYVVGRKREVIIAGGFNIYPAEVENAILAHPDIAEVVVVGLPDERLGEVPHAVVVASRPLTEAEVIEYCRDRIAHYKAVRGVTFVDAMPHSESQKIRRHLVRGLVARA